MSKDNQPGFWPVVVPAVITLALSIALYGYYVSPRDRSIFVEAWTEQATLTFDADTFWRMPGAVLCRPLPPQRGGHPPPAPDARCGRGEQDVAGINRIEWQTGTQVVFRRGGLTPPDIVTVHPTGSRALGQSPVPLQENDRIVLPPDFGPFRAIGALELGSASAAGPALLAGTYEWRESLLARQRPYITDEGLLRTGDWVYVGKHDCSETATADMLALPAPPDEHGFRIVFGVTSKLDENSQRPVLCLTRHGFARTEIRPYEIGRIIRDPIIIGMGLVLAVLATIFPTVRVAMEVSSLLARRYRRWRRMGAAAEHPDQRNTQISEAAQPGGERPSPPDPE